MKRPTQADLQAIELQCARAKSSNQIHLTGTALACMRGLFKCVTWEEGQQTQWDYYRRSIQEALATSSKPKPKIL